MNLVSGVFVFTYGVWSMSQLSKPHMEPGHGLGILGQIGDVVGLAWISVQIEQDLWVALPIVLVF